ncbi:MAG: zf-HC2 domain-containing protein [Acidobacteria bacterium]|nr:zf-HC2 domain-containing protein [Acidobacteriota bacterium]
MKLISFEDKSCERYRKHLDAYLSNELTVETNLDVLTHLERCPRCTEELETKQRVKNALKRAMDRQEPAPVDLQQKILKEIRPQSRPNYWWLAVAATIVLSVGAFGVLRWINTRHASNGFIKLGGNELISNNNAEMLNIGVGDHIHCALHRDFSAGPRSFERMSHDLGPEYIGLIPSVKERVPQDYTLMVGHRCDFKGRNFVHLILTNQKTILSVILTKKNGETFDKNAVAAVMQASGAPLYRARLQDQEVVGFETRDYLAYVVSGLPQDEHLRLASSLTPSVRNFLGRLEG